MYAVQPAGLQVKPDRTLRFKVGQDTPVIIGQGSQVPDDNGGNRIAYSYFQLGDLPVYRQFPNQFLEFSYSLPENGMQDFAGINIGNETAVFFPETHQHLFLPGDVFHAHSRLAPVAPTGCRQGREDTLRLHPTQVLQLFQQNRLLVQDLLFTVKVHQAAAATHAIVPAARLDP